ncbi:SURF6-domain-containing protein [Sarocladium strictum]
MPDFMQDYLRDVPQGLDSLLSLIPAKNYYVEDASSTWGKKKQSKSEAADAKRAKFDPDSKLHRNVKETWEDEQRNKRKIQDVDNGSDEVEAIEGIEIEKPMEGLKRKTGQAPKKQKTKAAEVEDEAESEAEVEDVAGEKPVIPEEAEPSRKESKKEAKKAAKKEKQKAKKDAKKSDTRPNGQDQSAETTQEPQIEQVEGAQADDDHWETDEEHDTPARKDQRHDADNSTPESEPQSPTFDAPGPSISQDASAEPASTTTSISSIVPPSEKPKHIKVPADTSALRARLAAKIESLRAARKADGTDGRPVRTRQELIESRRFKQAQRKEHKKELRRKAKLEEDQKREEALASNSPSVMSPAVELDEGGFAFGRVAFGDGAQLSHDLSYVLTNGKRKGPSDPKTALLKVQNQKKRLEELDEEKRKDIAEKEQWLIARRRAQGERIHDDESMLKKAVKRKEVAKKKSEKAWSERSQGVQKAQKDRQKKREENLKKRREEKNAPKGKKKKKAAAAGAKKKGGRPGFEGLGLGGRKK